MEGIAGHWIGGVTFHCDNTAAVSAITSGYSRVPNIILLLRCFHTSSLPVRSMGSAHTGGGERESGCDFTE